MTSETAITVSRVFLGCNAAGIGLIGVLYLANPNLLLKRYGLEVTDPSMDNMLRSAYGGLFLGMAGVFASGAIEPTRAADGLLFTALFMGGFLLGRVVSVARKGFPHVAVRGLMAFELVASVASLGLFSLLPGA